MCCVFVGQSCIYDLSLKFLNVCVSFFSSSADLESPVITPKKLDLTRENLNALLGQSSFIQKTSSTFSRGSGQTSGGRGPGKRGNMEKLNMFRERERFATQDVEEHTAYVSILTSHVFFLLLPTLQTCVSLNKTMV